MFFHIKANAAVSRKNPGRFPSAHNTFLAVSENFPAAAGGYRERPFLALFSVTRHQGCGCGCLLYIQHKVSAKQFPCINASGIVMFLHLIALLAIRIPCDTASRRKI